MRQQEYLDCIIAIRPLQIVIAHPITRKTIKILDFMDMGSWGRLDIENKPYFVIKMNVEKDLLIFATTLD